MAQMHLRWAALAVLAPMLTAACATGPAVGLASSDAPRNRRAGTLAGESRPRFSDDGAAGEEALGESLVAFRFDAGAPPSGPPAVGPDGAVYVATIEGYLHGLAPDGTFLSSYTLPQRLEGGLVADDAGIVYAAAPGGRIYALRPSGPLLWGFKIPVEPATELAPGPHGWLVFAAHDRNVYGVSRQGVARWRSSVGKRVTATPALDAAGRVVVGTDDGFLYALEPFQRRFRVQLGGPIASVRVGADGRLWVVAGETLYALDRQLAVRIRRPGVAAVAPWAGGAVAVGPRGAIAWLRPDGGAAGERAVAGVGRELAVDAAGTVYIAEDEGALAVVPQSGPVWRVRVGRAPVGAVVFDAARRRIIALSDDGRLAVLHALPQRSAR
jgi:outer membrane protein assembly factor BamB